MRSCIAEGINQSIEGISENDISMIGLGRIYIVEG